MKHIVEIWNENIYESSLWDFYFKEMKVGILDIETTGLYSAKNKFILGCLYNVSKGELHQVLAENRTEEETALSEYLRLIADVDMVVTYNGRRFDMPFLEQRRVITGCNEAPASCYNLDIYPVLKYHSPIRKLVPNMKQKTIENYMGFWESRADEISGAESVDLYNYYESTGDANAEKKILLHNNDDVRQLTKLTKAITKSDFHKAMYHIGFPIKTDNGMLIVKKTELRRDVLVFSGDYISNCNNTETAGKTHITNYMGFDYHGWPVQSEFCNGTFSVKVPIIRKDGFAIIDLEGANLETWEFENYPEFGSGFIIISEEDSIRYRQINHFISAFAKKLMNQIAI